MKILSAMAVLTISFSGGAYAGTALGGLTAGSLPESALEMPVPAPRAATVQPGQVLPAADNEHAKARTQVILNPQTGQTYVVTPVPGGFINTANGQFTPAVFTGSGYVNSQTGQYLPLVGGSKDIAKQAAMPSARGSYYWQTGTGPGSDYYWQTGTGAGSDYYWQTGTGPGSDYYWQTGTGPGSDYYWQTGTGAGSDYYWQTGTGPGSNYYWQTGTGPGSDYYWQTGSGPSIITAFPAGPLSRIPFSIFIK